MLTVVADGAASEQGTDGAAGGVSTSLIDEIVRDGARAMLAQALQAEVADYIEWFSDVRDENGRRMVVRNGSHEAREVMTAAGAVEVKAPRVNDRRTDPESGERMRFSSAILPPWCRKSPKINEVLPLLYLHGLSSGDFVPALGEFLGSAAGLSAATITRLTETWQAEQRDFAARDLSGVGFVYLWADGVHVNVRLEEHKLCLLVLVGVRADGRKALVAITDGYRESIESWADLLRDAKRRGMRAPVLAVGDGALGFWGALGEVFPETAAQRCWFHKIANVLGALPKSAHPGRRRHSRRSATPRTRPRRARPRSPSPPPTAPSTPRRSRRSPTTCRCCWPSTITRPSTGSTYGPPTRYVHVRHRAAPAEAHPRTRLAGVRAGHGLQAQAGGPGPLARGEPTPPGRSRPRRRHLHRRRTRRTTRRAHRNDGQSGGGLMIQIPADLDDALAATACGGLAAGEVCQGPRLMDTIKPARTTRGASTAEVSRGAA
jgi:transposase-like protein